MHPHRKCWHWKTYGLRVQAYPMIAEFHPLSVEGVHLAIPVHQYTTVLRCNSPHIVPVRFLFRSVWHSAIFRTMSIVCVNSASMGFDTTLLMLVRASAMAFWTLFIDVSRNGSITAWKASLILPISSAYAIPMYFSPADHRSAVLFVLWWIGGHPICRSNSIGIGLPEGVSHGRTYLVWRNGAVCSGQSFRQLSCFLKTSISSTWKSVPERFIGIIV